MWKQSVTELMWILLMLGYHLLVGAAGKTFTEQFTYIWKNLPVLIFLFLFNTFYELVLL